MHTHQRQQRAQRAGYRKAGYGARTPAGARLSQRIVATPVLIALNVLVYVITAAQAGSAMANQQSELFGRWVLWPLAISGEDQWGRLITSGFLHYGLLHLAMNMLALFILGRELEVLLGKVRYLALYLVSMLGGSTAVYVLGSTDTGTAGASGAIFGLMGAFLIAVIRLRINPSAALGIIAVNVFITFTIPGISMLGHLGGLALGALVMAAMMYAPEKNRTAWQAGTVVLGAVALAGLVLYRDAQLGSVYCDIVSGGQLGCANPAG